MRLFEPKYEFVSFDYNWYNMNIAAIIVSTIANIWHCFELRIID